MNSRRKIIIAIVLAVLSAVTSSLYMPFSSLLIDNGVTASLLGSFAYFGGGFIALLFFIFSLIKNKKKTKPQNDYLKGKDFLIVGIQILTSTGSTLCIMFALKYASASSVTLLSNFEIIMTSLLALIIFKEVIKIRTWVGIILIGSGCIFLTMDFSNGIAFSPASFLALGAALCWGIDNNLSRLLSTKNKEEATTIKCLGVGVVSLVIGLILGERFNTPLLCYGLLLGVVAIGISIILYMYAQKDLGAAKTSAFYALAPFLGAVISIFLLKEIPIWNFYVALSLVLVGQVIVTYDSLKKKIQV